MKLRDSSEFEKSRYDWIGLSPKSWFVYPLQTLCNGVDSAFVDGDWIESEDIEVNGTIRYLTSGNVGVGVYKDQGSSFITEERFENLNCTEVLPGDILISRLNLPIARACIVPEFDSKVVTCVDNVIVRPNKNVSRRFLVYLLSAEHHFANTKNLGRGTTMQRISGSVLGKIRFAIPGYDEQELIANLLDRETTKIDRLIQKQEKLIGLILEKQHSEILNCVTYGLQFSMDFKKSTNVWLDKIPSHWDEASLKVLSKIYSGGTPNKSKEEYWADGLIPWLNSGSVNDFYIHSPSEYITEDALKNSSAKWIKKGSVLVALAGQGKTKGMAAQLMFDSTCNQSMCAIVPDSKLDGNYLLWWLSANYQNIRNMAGGDLRDGLNLEMIGSIKCPIPPLQEQLAIASHLNTLREKNTALTNKCKESIEFLRERRASLISAAVTGKIDVRNT